MTTNDWRTALAEESAKGEAALHRLRVSLLKAGASILLSLFAAVVGAALWIGRLDERVQNNAKAVARMSQIAEDVAATRATLEAIQDNVRSELLRRHPVIRQD